MKQASRREGRLVQVLDRKALACVRGGHATVDPIAGLFRALSESNGNNNAEGRDDTDRSNGR